MTTPDAPMSPAAAAGAGVGRHVSRAILGAGLLGGIGFTMSIFISSIAFPGQLETAQSKVAIVLASFAAGVLGYLVLRFGAGGEESG